MRTYTQLTSVFFGLLLICVSAPAETSNVKKELFLDLKEEAKKIVEEASKKLLANPVMEYFELTV